jgi:hypothetical protein
VKPKPLEEEEDDIDLEEEEIDIDAMTDDEVKLIQDTKCNRRC